MPLLLLKMLYKKRVYPDFTNIRRIYSIMTKKEQRQARTHGTDHHELPYYFGRINIKNTYYFFMTKKHHENVDFLREISV